uniref:C-type lectin domain-containing protein n=1 Tax=Acrobeloides nanus TaxID=290746 RepID=A0A914DRH4_9BILA
MFSVITSLILFINLEYLYADCPAGFFVGVNPEDCFQIIDTPLENDLAQSDCYEKGGYLASIHDVATNLFVGSK